MNLYGTFYYIICRCHFLFFFPQSLFGFFWSLSLFRFFLSLSLFRFFFGAVNFSFFFCRCHFFVFFVAVTFWVFVADTLSMTSCERSSDPPGRVGTVRILGPHSTRETPSFMTPKIHVWRTFLSSKMFTKLILKPYTCLEYVCGYLPTKYKF